MENKLNVSVILPINSSKVKNFVEFFNSCILSIVKQSTPIGIESNKHKKKLKSVWIRNDDEPMGQATCNFETGLVSVVSTIQKMF